LYRWHWQLGRIERALGRPDAALAAYRRAVAELDQLRPGLALGSADAQLAFRSEIEPVYRGLVDLLLREAAAAARDARQTLLAEARDTLEAFKAAELRDHFGDACLDAQRKASPDEVPGTAVLYPVLLPDRVELVVSNETGLSIHTVTIDGPALEELARELRRLLARRTTLEYLGPSQRLYELLIRPVWPQLAGRTLVVVPDGALRNVPFAALRDEAEGRFLIEQLPLASSPGLTLTDPRPIDRASVQLLAAGLAESVAGFPALPAVEGELAGAAREFPGVVLLDEAFVADRFEGEVARRPVSIVHVASHGEFRGDAAESFVLAWDGPIPMERLAAVVGRTRYRAERPLELLVLSACETAAGDERASLGLAGVAVQSGARSALGSLWRVSDEATALLIEEFYGQLADPGVSRAEALRRAQRRLLGEVRFRHPYYWSPFLLVSNWL
jgi:CHAT domain-containing protein